MADDRNWDTHTADGRSTADEARGVPADLQARLARAYLSGNGAEVERVLALVAQANYQLPPKSERAA